MKSLTEKPVRFTDNDRRRFDGTAFLFLVGSFVFLTALTWNLGLYADDYWNLLEAARRDGFEYFKNHMTNINSRYTYALVNRAMYVFFYDPSHLFGWTYIRVARIAVLLLHFIGTWFLYKSLVRLDVPRLALLVLLPFVAFPVYGHQALFWLGAAFAYPVGFALFSTAVYALLLRKDILFAVLVFFAVGATEFVLLPSVAAAFAVWLMDARPGGRRGLRSKKLWIRAGVLLAPFIAWALLVALTPAAASRTGKIHAHPKIFEAPLPWFIAYFDIFLRRLQPEVWMQKAWYVFPALSAGAVVAARSLKARLTILFLAALYFLSILPLSAVGYDFRPIRTARVWYLPGIFFYTAVISALGLALRRVPFREMIRGLRVGRALLSAAIIAGVTIRLCGRLSEITTDGEHAYGCIRRMIETIAEESGETPPARAEVCGFPPALYDFSIFRSNYTGPYALALMFKSDRTVPFTRTTKCAKGWGTPWLHPDCPYEASYRVDRKKSKRREH